MGKLRISYANNREKIFEYIFLGIACVSIISVVLICAFLLKEGLPAIFEIGIKDFLFNGSWKPQDEPASYGILSMILGSIYVTVGALIFGVPIGILSAIYLSRFCPKKIKSPLRNFISILAGVPSVVYGFFGMVVLVPFVRNYFGGNGNSILTASILLGIMILPTIIELSTSALDSVPQSYYEGALSLGATHEVATFGVVLRGASSGVIASVVLGLGRAIGETMAVVMVVGNQAVLRTPFEVLKGVKTLTTNIITEMGYATGLHRQALISTGLVLFIFILIINLSFNMLKRRFDS